MNGPIAPKKCTLPIVDIYFFIGAPYSAPSGHSSLPAYQDQKPGKPWNDPPIVHERKRKDVIHLIMQITLKHCEGKFHLIKINITALFSSF